MKVLYRIVPLVMSIDTYPYDSLKEILIQSYIQVDTHMIGTVSSMSVNYFYFEYRILRLRLSCRHIESFV